MISKTRLLLLSLVAGVIFAACAGDAAPTAAPDTGAADGGAAAPAATNDLPEGAAVADDRAAISGTVVFADYSWNDNISQEEFINEFMEMYPNIIVERVWVPWNMPEQLTAWSAANELPCVAVGWEQLTFYISQGWLHPLNEFTENDPDIRWVPDFFLDAYEFGGQLYALPAWVQFNGIMINLDMLDQLNEDPPSYRWTLYDFERLANLATTATTSGITWSPFHEWMVGQFNRDLSIFAFNYGTWEFEFSNPDWTRSIDFSMRLRQVPGLFSDLMIDQDLRDAGELDDYQRKFGEGTDALRDGLVLMAPVGTWDGWIRDLPFNFDVWPLPQEPNIGYTSPIHADFGFMLSTARYPEAAYAFLRHITISTEGWLHRFDRNANMRWYDDDGVLHSSPNWEFPTNMSPYVQNAIREQVGYIPGFLYQYENMDQAWIADPQKIIPNFWQEVITPFWSMWDRILAGEIEAPSAAAELDQLINANLDREMAIFNEALLRVQAEFEASR